MAEEEGFEPSRRFPDLLAFETSPLSRLGTPPAKIIVAQSKNEYVN